MAVQVHRKMVREEDQTMSMVPRLSGPGTHPVNEVVDCELRPLRRKGQSDVRVASGMIKALNKTSHI